MTTFVSPSTPPSLTLRISKHFPRIGVSSPSIFGKPSVPRPTHCLLLTMPSSKPMRSLAEMGSLSLFPEEERERISRSKPQGSPDSGWLKGVTRRGAP
jgi:hypothetical protein